MDTAKCSQCNEIKNTVAFYKKNGRLGRRSECKSCTLTNKKLYFKLNKDMLRDRKSKDYFKHWTTRRSAQREYFQQNKTQIAAVRKIKYHTNLAFKLQHSLRSRLTQAVKNSQKSGSALCDLGCSIDEFKKYIEVQFKPGMTWDNWGRNGWHLDHKVPISKFDLSDPIQLKQAVHFSNLQPLWASENLRKGDR